MVIIPMGVNDGGGVDRRAGQDGNLSEPKSGWTGGCAELEGIAGAQGDDWRGREAALSHGGVGVVVFISVSVDRPNWTGRAQRGGAIGRDRLGELRDRIRKSRPLYVRHVKRSGQREGVSVVSGDIDVCRILVFKARSRVR